MRIAIQRRDLRRALHVHDGRRTGDRDGLFHRAHFHLGIHACVEVRRQLKRVRSTVAKPTSVNVIVYVPGRRSMMRY